MNYRWFTKPKAQRPKQEQESQERQAQEKQNELTYAYWSQQATGGWGPQDADGFVKKFLDMHGDDLKNAASRPRVVDIGCGNGIHLIFFAGNGFDAVGIEPFADMRNRAAEALAAAGQTAQILDAKSSSLPLEDASADVVISLGVSHHGTWEDANRDIAEAARILKPGGFLLFRVRSVNDTAVMRVRVPDIGYTARDLEGIKKGITHHYFTEDELRELGVRYALTILDTPKERVQQFGSRQRARWRVVYKKDPVRDAW